jgi:hypothetical protein
VKTETVKRGLWKRIYKLRFNNENRPTVALKEAQSSSKPLPREGREERNSS